MELFGDAGGGMRTDIQTKIGEAREVLDALDLPRAQRNDRSALTLLALAGIEPSTKWQDLTTRLIGVTPIMEWIRAHFDVAYAPNTRETIRRQTLHQFVDAGIVRYNPDDPSRAVNSPRAVYQLTNEAAELLMHFGEKGWTAKVQAFNEVKESLAARYGEDRVQQMVSISLPDGSIVRLSPGAHSQLIAAIAVLFVLEHAPGAQLIYIGDTGDKNGFFDVAKLAELGVEVDAHGKLPDVVLYDGARNWLILVESVTSHGPVDGKRKGELAELFKYSLPGLVYVTAFPDRQTMARYLSVIAWETEVWVADNPKHLIHFNGERFLGPY